MLLHGSVVFLAASGAFQFKNIRRPGHRRKSLAQAFLATVFVAQPFLPALSLPNRLCSFSSLGAEYVAGYEAPTRPSPPPPPPRHFERSRPTFSSAFAPANASACVERNLSALFLARHFERMCEISLLLPFAFEDHVS